MNKNILKGFTLIELMIVIAVIAILATLILFGLNRAQAAARDTQRQQIMNALRLSLERYMGDTNAYPTGISFLTSYMPNPLDPGCGSGKITMTMSAINASWTVAGCTGITYAYAQAGGFYTLSLYKESGGSNTFFSPR
jgi:general secretion pathway protein G